MSTDLHPAPSGPAPTDPPALGEASGRALRRVLGLLLVLAGIAGAFTLWSLSVIDVDESETTLSGVERIALDLNANGHVEVRVHDGDDVVVHQRVESTLTTVEVDQVMVGDVLELSTARCQRGLALLVNRCSASFVLTVPADTPIVGELAHGRVELVGLEAPVDVRTGHGRIEATDVSGDLDLRTDHGRVSLTRTSGDTVVQSGHGRLDLVEVTGPVRAVTDHGRVEVRGGSADLDVSTGHGRIELAGTEVGAATLVTGHGEVSFAPSSFPTPVTITTSHGSVDVTLPPGAPPYAVTTDANRGVDVGLTTDPAAEHRLDATTGHGSIEMQSRAP